MENPYSETTIIKKKFCGPCKTEKPIEAFSFLRKTRKRRSYCKDCESRYKHEWYLRYRDREIAHSALRVKAQRVRVKDFLIQAKSKPCLDCGGLFPPYVMDFDHLPGYVKLATLGKRNAYSLKWIQAEIAKCDLVCANCHRIRTETRRLSLKSSEQLVEVYL